jgi:hypothetical protein
VASAQQPPGGGWRPQEIAVGQVVTGGGSGGAEGTTEPAQPYVGGAGSGGAPPVVGSAGTGGTQEQDLCSQPYPAPGYAPGEWVPYEPVVPAGGELARSLVDGVRSVMAGSWRGVASTPWTSPYVVDITFSSDGHYSARCAELGDCCLAFYYGTDADAPIKQWRVDDATLSGDVFGEIDIAFGYGQEFGLPSWQGELSHIERDASGDGLRFEFATSSGYGPLRYDLRRVQ